MEENTDFLSDGKKDTIIPEKKKRVIKKEPLVETPEVVVGLEKIETALKKENVTTAALIAMKENFMKLTIRDIYDKEGYDEVYKARQMCKNTRVLTKKICEKGRETAIAEQRVWIAKEKEITGEISKVEEYLQKQEDVVNAEKERIKAEKEAIEQQRIQSRTAELLRYGMIFNGEQYVLGEHIITATQVKLLDDLAFTNFLVLIEDQYKKEQAIKAQIEADAKVKAEEQTRIAEQQAKQKADLEARQKELDDREAAMKTEAETQRKKLEEEKLAAEQLKIKQRASILYSLGMSFTGEQYVFQELVVTSKQISDMSVAEFDTLIASITPNITNRKAKLEEQRVAEIEKQKEEAASKARKEAEDKIKADQETKIKADQEAKAEAERLAALAPDKQKIAELATILQNIKMPDMSTAEGAIVIVEIKQQFEKFVIYLKNKSEKIK